MIGIDASDLARVVAATLEQVTPSEDDLRAVGFSGAEVFREEAKANAAKNAKTWTIHKSIIVKRLTEVADGGRYQAYLVTVRQGSWGGGDAFYWKFVEHGHKFVPKNKKVSKKTGRTIGWAAHRRAAALEYGTASAPAYPFMRPAYESKKAASMDAMTKTLQQQLERNAS